MQQLALQMIVLKLHANVYKCAAAAAASCLHGVFIRIELAPSAFIFFSEVLHKFQHRAESCFLTKTQQTCN